MSNRYYPIPALGTVAVFAPGLALAHHPLEGEMPGTLLDGILSGLAHPVIGPEHLGFLLVVAIVAWYSGNTARKLLPVAFVLATLVGALVYMASPGWQGVGLWLAISTVAAGIVAFTDRRLRLEWTVIAGGLGGLLHGYAYGEGILGARNDVVVSYLIGFTLVQLAVLWTVMFLLTRAQRTAGRNRPILVLRSISTLALALGTAAVILELG